MPFTRLDDNDYVSPSGRHFTKKQVALYYATGGFSKVLVRKKRKLKRHK